MNAAETTDPFAVVFGDNRGPRDDSPTLAKILWCKANSACEAQAHALSEELLAEQNRGSYRRSCVLLGIGATKACYGKEIETSYPYANLVINNLTDLNTAEEMQRVRQSSEGLCKMLGFESYRIYAEHTVVANYINKKMRARILDRLAKDDTETTLVRSDFWLPSEAEGAFYNHYTNWLQEHNDRILTYLNYKQRPQMTYRQWGDVVSGWSRNWSPGALDKAKSAVWTAVRESYHTHGFPN